jgi:hypothetical protein
VRVRIVSVSIAASLVVMVNICHDHGLPQHCWHNVKPPNGKAFDEISVRSFARPPLCSPSRPASSEIGVHDLCSVAQLKEVV